ncbi:hypothetical protein E2I00_003848, partial [Balaenoptera physalus]
EGARRCIPSVMGHGLASEVQQLLHNKFVVILADSVQRAMHKDLVLLLQKDCLLTLSQLKAKGEYGFEQDELVQGGKQGRMHNGTHYREPAPGVLLLPDARVLLTCDYLEAILEELHSGEHDRNLVIMSSCLWDLTRYGEDSWPNYLQNLESLFGHLCQVTPPFLVCPQDAHFSSDHPFQSNQFSLNHFHSDIPPTTQTEFAFKVDFICLGLPSPDPVISSGPLWSIGVFPGIVPVAPMCPGEGGPELPREGPQPMESQGLSRLTWDFLLMHMDWTDHLTLPKQTDLVHGRNLLSIDYDRNIRTEKIYDDHRKFTLRIIYDQVGRPFLWLPSSGLAAVNVSYFFNGRLAGLQRGAMSERTDIDKQGRIVSRMFADGKVWSYSYLDKSMVLLLQSQRQYIFEYDSSERLHAVTMPSVARHSMSTHTSIGYIRNTYNPPESNASVIFDYSDDGRILKTSFLGTGRQVFYKYGKLSKLSEIVYDSTAITFGYDETTGVLKMVSLQSGGFSCTIRYRKIGPLVDKQIYRFSEEGMVNARFEYTYHDNSFRIASVKPVISETPLPVDLYRYDEISGKVEHFGKFGVIYYDINQIITTAVMTLSKHFDTHGRIKEVQYEMFRSLMYWMTVQYDSMGRVIKRELKLGPYANTTKYTYDYDGDGQLQSVAVNDRPTWRYSYDLNGNLHLLNPGNSVRLMPLRYDLRDRITRLGDVQYKIDDDGYLCQRGADIFEYNSKGLLTRAYNKASGWSVQYRYDGVGRRASYKTNLGHHLQYFYSDLHNPTRITHVYNHSNSEITSLYYDLQGHLFAMESSSGEEYYVASDNTGTPLAVFSINGLMIKQLQYTAYGEIYYDSNPDFQMVIGFHGGLYDPLTKLVHFTQRDYDVLAGRWTSPDYTMWKNVGKEPAPFNLYMFKSNNPLSNELDLKNYVTDVKSWLVMFGFQLSNIIPGFPRAKMYFVPPPYELSESQASENGQNHVGAKGMSVTEENIGAGYKRGVKRGDFTGQRMIFLGLKRLITGVQQTTERHNQAFMALEGQVISKKLHASIREKAGHWFATTTPIIGKGIMFAIKEGRVTTGTSSVASEDSRKVASVLNNAYYLDKMHYSIEGKDTHYFVKIGSADADLVTLGTTIGRKVLESGVNVTVSQPTLLVNGRTRRFTNIEFQYSTLLLSIRYGLTPDTLDEEKARILDQARQRALGTAWAKEQQKARDGREGSRLWTEGEKQQLLSTGRVQGYEGYYVLPVEQYPELADSSSNIQFLRQNEMGKR